MSICCWVFRLRISLIVNVARKVWEKKICDCWHRTRRWLENWRKCQCCQVTWHSCSNHSNNLLFSLLMIEGAGTGKKIIWMGKMSNTIWFSFHTKRKIKWILLSQTLKMEHTYRLTHTHTNSQIQYLKIHTEIGTTISSAIVIRSRLHGIFKAWYCVYNDIICSSQTLDCDLMCNQIAFRSNGKENSIQIEKMRS